MPRSFSFLSNHALQARMQFLHKCRSRSNRVGIPFGSSVRIFGTKPDGLETSQPLLTHLGHGNDAIDGDIDTGLRRNFANNLETILDNTSNKLAFPFVFLRIARILGATRKAVIDQAVKIHKEPLDSSVRMATLNKGR